jgi:structure-specific recognition protein 1
MKKKNRIYWINVACSFGFRPLLFCKSKLIESHLPRLQNHCSPKQMSSQSWSVRHHHARGHIAIADTGITFKSTAGMDDKAAVTATEISKSNVAFLILGPRTRQLRLTKPDGTVVRFDGFKRDDVENITALFQSQFNVAVATVYPSSTGKNFGTLDLDGDSVSFKIDDKICAEFHTEDIAQVVKQGDLQVEMQFEERQLQGSDAQLMRIQFYVPDDHSPEVGAGDDLDEDQVEALSTGAGRLRHRLVAAAGITSVTGEKILALPDDVGTFLAPRGRYVVEMYQTYFRLYGKQYDNRVFYQDIVSYFLLHNPNGVEQVFIITLRENKKLRMGNQSYQHLVMNMKSNKNVNINIWPSPEKLIEMFGANDKGEAKLNQEYANVPLPKTVATLFREISGKKVFVAGSFESHKGGHAVRSALKNSDGLLFPTRNTLIFIHKPTIFIKYKDILTIEFQRYDGQMGRSHTFDLCVSCRSVGGEAPREWTFSSIDKHEYTRLLAYLHGKQNIEVKNMLVESGGRGRGRAGQDAEDADAAMNMFGEDDDEGSDADRYVVVVGVVGCFVVVCFLFAFL